MALVAGEARTILVECQDALDELDAHARLGGGDRPGATAAAAEATQVLYRAEARA